MLTAGMSLFKAVLALGGMPTKKGAFMRGLATVFVLTLAAVSADRVAAATPQYDVVIRGGTVYDGSGGTPYTADIAVRGDRIAAIARHLDGRGVTEIDAGGKAVSPGFINMLSHPEASLIADGRGLSDLAQGVTLEVIGEDSPGPLTPEMKRLEEQRQGDIKFPITWTTLGGYLDMLQKKGISLNIASFVGAGTVRTNLLGEVNVDVCRQCESSMTCKLLAPVPCQGFVELIGQLLRLLDERGNDCLRLLVVHLR